VNWEEEKSNKKKGKEKILCDRGFGKPELGVKLGRRTSKVGAGEKRQTDRVFHSLDYKAREGKIG